MGFLCFYLFCYALLCVRSGFIITSVAVDLLFDVLPIVCGISVFLFVLLCIALCLFWFNYHLEEEERNAGCFAVVVLEMHCYYRCSVAPPHSAVGLSEVCDCDIS